MGIYMPAYQSNRRRGYGQRNTPNWANPEIVEAYKLANPEVWAWCEAGAKRDNEFACSMVRAINVYGKLTEKQFAAVQNSIVRDRDRAATYAIAEMNATACSVPALETAFANAKAAGVSWPKLTFAEFTFSPAGANSTNPGAIYVKDRETRDYLGKVMNGKFIKSFKCNEVVEADILRVCADPHNEALAYGKKFGVCCACNRTLTDPKSVEKGIGPVCEKTFGWQG